MKPALRENLIKSYQAPLTVGMVETLKKLTGAKASAEAIQLALFEYIEWKESQIKEVEKA